MQNNNFKPSAKEYGESAIKMIDEHALYASGNHWKETKEQLIEKMKHCKTYEETLPFIEEALEIAGGKHSFIIRKMPAVNSKKVAPTYPTVSCENYVLYIHVPPFSGNLSDSQKYKDIIEHALLNEAYNHVIIDFIKNSGGDMGPMISGLASLLEDGYLMSFVMKADEEHRVYLDNGEVIGAGTQVKVTNRKYRVVNKIAILVSGKTASSGEITVLAFDGVENCKIFGVKSAGYTTSNNTIELYDGVLLNITSAKLKTRTGKIYDNEAIIPDFETASPYEDAMKWFINN